MNWKVNTMDSDYARQEAEDINPPFIANINPQCLLLNYDGLVSVQRRKLRFCHELNGGVRVFVTEDIEQMPEVVWYLPDDVSVEKVKSFIEKNVSLMRKLMSGWSVSTFIDEDLLEPRWDTNVNQSAQTAYKEVENLISRSFGDSDMR